MHMTCLLLRAFLPAMMLHLRSRQQWKATSLRAHSGPLIGWRVRQRSRQFTQSTVYRHITPEAQ